MRKRLDVKPTSANNDRQLASRMNFINCPRSSAPKFFGAHLFVKRYDADQMMECFRERCSIRLRRQQIEPVINLKRIRTTISAPISCATSAASLDFPVPVGPTIKKTAFTKQNRETCALAPCLPIATIDLVNFAP